MSVIIRFEAWPLQNCVTIVVGSGRHVAGLHILAQEDQLLMFNWQSFWTAIARACVEFERYVLDGQSDPTRWNVLAKPSTPEPESTTPSTAALADIAQRLDRIERQLTTPAPNPRDVALIQEARVILKSALWMVPSPVAVDLKRRIENWIKRSLV